MRKKGQVTFNTAPNMLLTFAIMAMIAAASVLALTGFKDGVSTRDLTGLSNETEVSTANLTLDRAITGFSNFSNQLGTVGTMMGVGLLLLIVIGVFGYIGSRGSGGL